MGIADVLGTSLIALTAVRLVLALRAPIRREAARRRARFLAAGRLRQRVDEASRRYQAWRNADLAWRGVREFTISRREREDRADVETAARVVSLYLTPRDGAALPPFRPGQYVTLHLAYDGAARAARRCYALSDLPRPDYYRITVAAPDDEINLLQPSAARYLISQQLGAIVQVEAPRGIFAVEPSDDRPLVFIAGGIGIAPIACMLRASAKLRPRKFLFYGIRDDHDHLMREQLERLEKTCDLQLFIRYSRASSTVQQTAGSSSARFAIGYIDIELLRAQLPSSDCQFYVCGPSAMAAEITAALSTWGVPADRIHSESWNAVPRPVVADPAPAGTESIEVTFRKSGKVCRWDPRSSSLLDFAEDNGVNLGSGCRAGSCGACATAASGAVRYLREPSAIPAPGTCLACIAVPAGNLVVDA